MSGHCSNPGKKLCWLRSSEFRASGPNVFDSRANDICWQIGCGGKMLRLMIKQLEGIELPFTEVVKTVEGLGGG